MLCKVTGFGTLESLHATSCYWIGCLLLTYSLSCIVSKLLWIIGKIFFFAREVDSRSGEPINLKLWNLASWAPPTGPDGAQDAIAFLAYMRPTEHFWYRENSVTLLNNVRSPKSDIFIWKWCTKSKFKPLSLCFENTWEKCQSNKRHGLIGLSPLPLATPLVYSGAT